MPDHYDQLYDGYVDGDAFAASEYDSLVRIIDTQLQGALAVLGEGVASGGEVAGGTGLAVDITALQALIETQKGLVYVEAGAYTLSALPASSSLWVWAQALLPDATDYDSRETGAVRYVYTRTATSPGNAILLATVATGAASVSSVTDARSFCIAGSLDEMEATLADLEAAVGLPYTDPSTLSDRVQDLEDHSVGGDGYAYWNNMPKAVGDTTTPGQEMDTKDKAAVTAHVAEYHADDGGTSEVEVNEPWDVDAVNQALMLMDVTQRVSPDTPETQRDHATIVWTVYGDGEGHDEVDFVDRVNTTWLPT